MHLATYREPAEMLEVIRYSLDHAARREAIAAAGRAEAVGRHSYRHRMGRLLERAEWVLGRVAVGLGGGDASQSTVSFAHAHNRVTLAPSTPVFHAETQRGAETQRRPTVRRQPLGPLTPSTPVFHAGTQRRPTVGRQPVGQAGQATGLVDAGVVPAIGGAGSQSPFDFASAHAQPVGSARVSDPAAGPTDRSPGRLPGGTDRVETSGPGGGGVGDPRRTDRGGGGVGDSTGRAGGTAAGATAQPPVNAERGPDGLIPAIQPRVATPSKAPAQRPSGTVASITQPASGPSTGSAAGITAQPAARPASPPAMSFIMIQMIAPTIPPIPSFADLMLSASP